MTSTTTPSLIPVLSLLVRGTGVCHIDDVTTAVPFARELLTRDPDPLEAVSIVERFIDACSRTDGFAHTHEALRERGAEIVGGEEFNLGDAVNIYAAPGVALGMALAYIALMEGGVR
jgi:hypothetical protein